MAKIAGILEVLFRGNSDSVKKAAEEAKTALKSAGQVAQEEAAKSAEAQSQASIKSGVATLATEATLRMAAKTAREFYAIGKQIGEAAFGTTNVEKFKDSFDLSKGIDSLKAVNQELDALNAKLSEAGEMSASGLWGAFKEGIGLTDLKKEVEAIEKTRNSLQGQQTAQALKGKKDASKAFEEETAKLRDTLLPEREQILKKHNDAIAKLQEQAANAGGVFADRTKQDALNRAKVEAQLRDKELKDFDTKAAAEAKQKAEAEKAKKDAAEKALQDKRDSLESANLEARKSVIDDPVVKLEIDKQKAIFDAKKELREADHEDEKKMINDTLKLQLEAIEKTRKKIEEARQEEIRGILEAQSLKAIEGFTAGSGTSTEAETFALNSIANRYRRF